MFGGDICLDGAFNRGDTLPLVLVILNGEKYQQVLLSIRCPEHNLSLPKPTSPSSTASGKRQRQGNLDVLRAIIYAYYYSNKTTRVLARRTIHVSTVTSVMCNIHRFATGFPGPKPHRNCLIDHDQIYLH